MRARADARAPRCAGGERALLIAAKEGREDLVELLLGFKAEVDARDAVCFSPLSLSLFSHFLLFSLLPIQAAVWPIFPRFSRNFVPK